ncbi:Epidermal growth factor-related protein 1 [Intoshia linei]|uniref:Epidermal growth factor-related protein 1 n=1 Tax=Intoshia linei TaxID=1819745 RepID=A0A177BAT8_9BILA|nr:Epidermal growth factor-related protein 1 [Intoshia linei]
MKLFIFLFLYIFKLYSFSSPISGYVNFKPDNITYINETNSNYTSIHHKLNKRSIFEDIPYRLPCLHDSVNVVLSKVQCQCNNDYYIGNLCQYVNPCYNKDNKCIDGAICNPIIKDYTVSINCTCDKDDCYKPKESNCLCMNDGVCEDGTCLCNYPFHGSYCEMSSLCNPNPCERNGKCEQISFDMFICHCKDGWTGPRCLDDLNECELNPCFHNGKCRNLLADFECECPPQWHGKTCELSMKPCVSHKCLHAIECIVTGNYTYKCVCLEGYTGADCEKKINYCENNECENDSLCVPINNSYSCHCDEGFTGLFCQTDIDECDTNICQHGQCVNVHGGFYCNCELKYYGDICDKKYEECDSEYCNGGDCYLKNNHYYCFCPKGSTGSKCELKDKCYFDNKCYGNSTCVVNFATGDAQCNCPMGFMGDLCDIDYPECIHHHPTENPLCFNGGTCRDILGGYVCDCQPGFEGFSCLLLSNACWSNPCENQGVCHHVKDTYYCECTIDYTGETCNNYNDPCLKKNLCSSHSLCIGLRDGVSGYKCDCDFNYSGKFCDIYTDPCSLKPCQFGGHCLHHNNTKGYMCQCVDDNYGENCEYHTNFCQNYKCINGYCVVKKSNPKCVCNDGYVGIYCQKFYDYCENNPCLHNGGCKSLIGDFECTCPEGTTGKICEIIESKCYEKPCHNNSKCTSISNGDYICKCESNYFGKNCQFHASKICNYSNCDGNKYCQLNSEKRPNYTCKCLPTFTGLYCDLAKKHICYENSPCLNNSNCIELPDKNFTCKCIDGFSGKLCENVNLNCNNCSNEGKCHRSSNKLGYICECVNEFYGLNCEFKSGGSCFKKCLNGKCLMKVENSKVTPMCICSHFYAGEMCQHVSCEMCFNGGKCIENAGKFYCDCPIGFTGKQCHIVINHCDKNICGSQKICINYVNGYKCEAISTNFYKKAWQHCSSSNCHLKFKNNYCDDDCNSSVCNFDGFDCGNVAKDVKIDIKLSILFFIECQLMEIDMYDVTANLKKLFHVNSILLEEVQDTMCPSSKQKCCNIVHRIFNNANASTFIESEQEAENFLLSAVAKRVSGLPHEGKIYDVETVDLNKSDYSYSIIVAVNILVVSLFILLVVIRKRLLNLTYYPSGHSATKNPRNLLNLDKLLRPLDNGAYLSIPNKDDGNYPVKIIPEIKKLPSNVLRSNQTKLMELILTKQVMSMKHECVSLINGQIECTIQQSMNDINYPCTSGETALHIAASCMDVETIKVLIKYKSDVNILDNEGYTPLHTAVYYLSAKTVAVLLEASVKTNLKCQGGLTPINLASRLKFYPTFQLLFDANCDLNIPDTMNHSLPIHWASISGDASILNLILTKFTNVSVANNKRQTPLHFAAMCNNTTCLKLLLNKGADLSLRNVYNQTPLDLATIRNCKECVFEIENFIFIFICNRDIEKYKRNLESNIYVTFQVEPVDVKVKNKKCTKSNQMKKTNLKLKKKFKPERSKLRQVVQDKLLNFKHTPTMPNADLDIKHSVYPDSYNPQTVNPSIYSHPVKDAQYFQGYTLDPTRPLYKVNTNNQNYEYSNCNYRNQNFNQMKYPSMSNFEKMEINYQYSLKRYYPYQTNPNYNTGQFKEIPINKVHNQFSNQVPPFKFNNNNFNPEIVPNCQNSFNLWTFNQPNSVNVDNSFGNYTVNGNQNYPRENDPPHNGIKNIPPSCQYSTNINQNLPNPPNQIRQSYNIISNVNQMIPNEISFPENFQTEKFFDGNYSENAKCCIEKFYKWNGNSDSSQRASTFSSNDELSHKSSPNTDLPQNFDVSPYCRFSEPNSIVYKNKQNQIEQEPQINEFFNLSDVKPILKFKNV